jgi:hypothetical protein
VRPAPRKRPAKAKLKPGAKKARKRVKAVKPPSTPAVETVVVDVIEEPVAGVTVVNKFEAKEAREPRPRAAGGESFRASGTGRTIRLSQKGDEDDRREKPIRHLLPSPCRHICWRQGSMSDKDDVTQRPHSMSSCSAFRSSEHGDQPCLFFVSFRSAAFAGPVRPAVAVSTKGRPQEHPPSL